MDDFGETDAAADFLARERETLGDMEAEIIADNGNGGTVKEEQMSSGSFEMVDEKADDFSEDPAGAGIEESFAGMQIPSNVSVFKEVPEKIRLWEENQKQMLEQKDLDEQEAIEKLRRDGKQELETWYKNHDASLDKTRAMRASDSEMTTETNGTTETEDWKSIYNLIDQAKASKTSGRDTTRMRSIFLQLKQTPLARDNN